MSRLPWCKSYIHPGKKSRLPLLREAAMIKPFPHIRLDIHKTAYAAYMAELINEWMEEGIAQPTLFYLFQYVLEAMDADKLPLDAVSVLFQMRFMAMTGFKPNLTHCSCCRTSADDFQHSRNLFDLKRGGLVCDKCTGMASGNIFLSKGTIKQLLWMERVDLKTAGRMRFSPTALKEGLGFLEAFVPFYLGKEPRSLRFIQQLRG